MGVVRNDDAGSVNGARVSSRLPDWPPRLGSMARIPRAAPIVLGWAVVVVVVMGDLALSHVALIGLLALAPLCSAPAMRWKATCVLSLAALVAAIALGGPDKIGGSAQQVTECVLVALVGLAATAAAAAAGSREEALREARALATHDTLTGALTRRAFFAEAEHLCLIRPEDRPALTIAIFDVDHFKQVNDEHGHLVGDDVLAEVARRITERTRAGDLVCRFGGEEFALLIVGPDGSDVVERVVAQVRCGPVVIGDRSVQVTASAGWASVDNDLHVALSEADRNLYEAKRWGGDQTVGGTKLRP